jgi:hypothetical protein
MKVPWSRVVEELLVHEVVEKLYEFYGTERFIAVGITAHYISLS